VVKRRDTKGSWWIEPPYSPAEQRVLGGEPPFPDYVAVEMYAVSIRSAVDEEGVLSEIELALYFKSGTVIGGEILPREYVGPPIRGRKLERDIAQLLYDLITGTDREDDPSLL
jgi:hypothetical protein